MAPRLNVQAPNFVPAGSSLIQTAQMRGDDSNIHWRGGVAWQDVCGGGTDTTYDLCTLDLPGVTGTQPIKTPTADQEFYAATPFTVRAAVECSAPAFYDRQDEVISQAFSRSEAWQVERAFWTGVAGGQPAVYPHLAASASVVLPNGLFSDAVTYQMAASVVTGSMSPVRALGELESALGDCLKGLGVIHMAPKVASLLSTNGILRREGTRLLTLNGNQVVAGIGYPGTDPSGAAPISGTSWMYATGQIFGYRSPVHVLGTPAERINRSNNTVTVHAERTYLFGYGCCLLAVLVNLDG